MFNIWNLYFPNWCSYYIYQLDLYQLNVHYLWCFHNPVWMTVSNIFSSPSQKNYMRSILQVYFDYASFTLQILEVKLKYALLELPKKKYKWSIKTEKRYFVYFSDIWYLYFLTFVEMNYTSSILLSLKINILI